jgi:hypothetical protein
VGKVLCISAVVLVLLVGIYIVASNVGDAPPTAGCSVDDLSGIMQA